MRRFAFFVSATLVLGSVSASCGLEGGGPSSDTADGSNDDVAAIEAGWPDVPKDVTYDIPDLGMSETEAGVPCTCAPQIPAGWELVAYNPTKRSPCPMYYQGQQTDYVENPAAAASTCSCTCNDFQTKPACMGNITVSVKAGSSNACNNGPTHTFNNVNTVCAGGGWNANPGNGKLNWMAISANAPAPTAGTCNAPTTTTNIPMPTADLGRACTLTAALGACAMNEACLPDVPMGESLCIRPTMGAPMSCPADYPILHRAGAGILDTRACGPGACTCTAVNGTCTTPQVDLYTDNNCNNSGLPAAQAADGVCRQVNVGDNQNFQNANYTSTNQNSQCAPSAYQPIGSLDVLNPVAICCR